MIQSRVIANDSGRESSLRSRRSGPSDRLLCFVPVAAAAMAAAALAAPAAQAQQCACSNLVPSGMQINACRMNEDGGAVSNVVGTGSTAPTRHANFYTPGITVTHVCMGLASASGQPGDFAEIQFRSVDPGTGMPGAAFYTQVFSITPNLANFQIVQLTTPQSPGANYWLTVEYPNATSGVLHQGTRARTGPPGSAVVQIDGFPWETYDSIPVTGYGPNAPIIRALELRTVVQPQCPPHISQSCCNIVCALDPSCCAAGGWTPACDILAQDNCPVDCVTCPPGAIQACGACASGQCGGCTTGTGFETAQCGETYCGELEAVAGTPVDEHWYELDIPAVPGGFAQVVLDIEAEFPVEVEIHDDSCSQPFPIIYNADQFPECTPVQIGAGVPAPSTIHIVVRPDVAAGYPCGTTNTYTMHVDVIDPASGASCPSATGCVSCPAGGIASCGACGSGQCDGCINGNFEIAQCGQAHCGELFADGSGIIDEHWYELAIPPVGPADVVLTIEADMDVEVELHDNSCSGNIISTFTSPACIATSNVVNVPTPIDLHIVVRPAVIAGHPCGTANAYTLHVDVIDQAGVLCPAGGCPAPPHDECAFALPAFLGANPTDYCGASASDPPEVHADCPVLGFGGAGSNSDDLWYEFTSTCSAGSGRDFVFLLAPDPALPPTDRVLGMYDTCSSPLQFCDEAFGGASAVINRHLVPGESVILRAGAPGGALTPTSGILRIEYANVCCWDLNGDCVVNIFDLLDLLAMWGQPCPNCSPSQPCNIFALLDLLANWGDCP